jgi:hypothetical protein
MNNSEAIDAYQRKMLDYEAAKHDPCRRLKAFTDLLVAERIVMSRLGIGAVPHLSHYLARYYP